MDIPVNKRRNIKDCKFWKPRGKVTHYCTIDKNDPLKLCFGVCKLFEPLTNNNENEKTN